MVEFYGSSFDAFYRNKKFIYRGQEAEKLSQFIERMKARFGEIEILNQDPTEEQKKEEKKCTLTKKFKIFGFFLFLEKKKFIKV